MISRKQTMRDALIEGIYQRMAGDDTLMFLAADFGSPKLDQIRADYPDRFVNVGIAEQNLVNVAAGLALEGFTVYAYAIAPFLVMRAYEQIRNNLSLLSHTHQVNVNLVGVGGGLSYDVSGPTHHSLEDISIIRALPNLTVFSPSDWVLAEQFVERTISVKTPKYLRFDGKPLPNIYAPGTTVDFVKGFSVLTPGEDVCLVATGYMTHKALRVVESLAREGIRVGLIDVFMIKPLAEEALAGELGRYRHVITLEEAFIRKGGLDTVVANLLRGSDGGVGPTMTAMGFEDAYVFAIASRDQLHDKSGIGEEHIKNAVQRWLHGEHKKQKA